MLNTLQGLVTVLEPPEAENKGAGADDAEQAQTERPDSDSLEASRDDAGGGKCRPGGTGALWDAHP